VDLFEAAVDTLERSADGLATRAEWGEAEGLVYSFYRRHGLVDPAEEDATMAESHALGAVMEAFLLSEREGLVRGVRAAVREAVTAAGLRSAAAGRRAELWRVGEASMRAKLASVVADVFGPLPFRDVTLEPSLLTSTVVALARQMYESKDFSPMPILADALMDVGCEQPDMLDHCRNDGTHVRGNWVVDLVLGKT
jgi:hypothetical protein